MRTFRRSYARAFSVAALSALALTTAASAGKPPKIGIDKISGVPNPSLAVASSLCADSTGAPWASIGLTRPTYVNVCAERRLRLLPALPAMEQSIAAEVKGYFANMGPGMTVGLVLDDGLYYSQGFGFADLAKTRTPDETTIYRPGSLSKVVTATGLLALIDDSNGAIKLTDNADTYLPELKSVCPAGAKPETGSIVASCPAGASHLGIQLFHLTSHSSGLADVLGTDVPWLTKFAKSSLLFPPGEFSAYSGVSFEAAGILEGRVSHLSYAEYIRTHLFVPLGMTHSTMDPSLLPANLQSSVAQTWNLTWGAPDPLYATWSLAPFTETPPGGPVKEILPAGGLATSVWDLSRFLKMWISNVPPVYHGHALISQLALKNAVAPAVPATTPVPAKCGDFNDAAGDYFSACDLANVFGVGWDVSSSPSIWHNGIEPNWAGSWNEFQLGAKMGVTALVSTLPFPDPYPLPYNVTPGFDKSFAYTVAHTDMLGAGVTADAQTTWMGAALSAGVARLLWLSGVEATSLVPHPIEEPKTKPPIIEHPNIEQTPAASPRGGQRTFADMPAARERFGAVFAIKTGPGSTTQAGQPNAGIAPIEQSRLLAQFTPAFAGANHLGTANVAQFVADSFGADHNCSTFRVRRVVSATKIALRLACVTRNGNHADSVDVTLTVDNAGLIAALDGMQAGAGDY